MTIMLVEHMRNAVQGTKIQQRFFNDRINEIKND